MLFKESLEGIGTEMVNTFKQTVTSSLEQKKETQIMNDQSNRYVSKARLNYFNSLPTVFIKNPGGVK